MAFAGLVATTHCVWSKRDDEVERIPFLELHHVCASTTGDGRIGVSQIEIEKNDGSKTSIDMEPGPPFVAMLNVLRLTPRPSSR